MKKVSRLGKRVQAPHIKHPIVYDSHLLWSHHAQHRIRHFPILKVVAYFPINILVIALWSQKFTNLPTASVIDEYLPAYLKIFTAHLSSSEWYTHPRKEGRQTSNGVASWGGGGGRGGDRPLWQKLCPPLAPKWNYTLYRGLWRAAILSPGQPPLLTPQHPLRPPHFEKSGYAPANIS